MQRKSLFLLIPCLLFTGCEVSSSSFDSDSSESINNFNGDYILDTLNKMTQGNFTLEYVLGENTFQDVITSKYYYIGYLNNGAMLLNALDDKVYAYDYQIVENNEIELKGQTFNEEQTRQELTSLAFINKLSDLSLNGISFEKIDDKYYSNNTNLIEKLSSQLDFSSGLSQVVFYLENNNLTFELQYQDVLTKRYYTPEGGKVAIKNVLTSSIECVDKFLNDWSKPTETLENKANNLFTDVSFVSAIYDYTLDYNRALLHGYSNVDLYSSYIRITTINEENVPYVETYKKINDNDLKLIGVNGKNEVVNQDTTKKYSSFKLVGKDGFELDKFRKLNNDDRYYIYLGSSAQALAYSITQANIFAKYKCLKIQVEVNDNKVTNMHFFTGIMQDKDTGEFFYYRIDTSVNEANIITDVSKKTPSKDDEEIKSYLNKINSSSFVIESIDSAWEGGRKTYLSKKDNYFIKETYYISEGEKNGLEKAEVYYQKDDKTYCFSFDDSYNVTLNKQISKSINEIVNFSISSEILLKKDNYLYTTGDIINLGDSLGIISYPLFIDPSSLRMNIVDSSISSLEYTYGGSGFTGNEKLTFTYGDFVIPETLINNINKSIPSTTSTWKDYLNGWIYQELIKSFSEEIANKVPYLYDSIFDGVDGFDCYENDTNDFFIYSMVKDNGYIAKYKNYLLSLGFNQDNNIFIKDNLKLIVGDSLDDFLHISII